MPVSQNLFVTPQIPKVAPQNFVQGTDTAGTLKTVYSAGANGSKITAFSASTNDGTVAHVVTIYITRSAVDYILSAVNVPVNSGTNGTVPSVDLLSLIPGLPVDNDGQKYLFLQSGDTLRATFATALTASTKIDVVAIGADF
jgi:hypothetical protein